jgi:predicted permease
VIRDVRAAAAGFWRDKTFACVAIGALALGIAANTAVFTLVNAVFFKALPFDGSDRIAFLTSPFKRNIAEPDARMSFRDFTDVRASARSFTALAAGTGQESNLSDGAGESVRANAFTLTSNGLALIGRAPVLGRGLTPADESFSNPPVVVLGNTLWTTHFASDRNVIGKTVKIDGVATTIVGVNAPGVSLGARIDLWLPIRPEPARAGDSLATYTGRDIRVFLVFGRLAPGATRQSAAAELRTIASRLETQYPESNKDVTGRVVSYNELTFNVRVKALMIALQGAVAFVLLIACSNVANLLLARGVRRSTELSLRSALGASRKRLVRQLLTESLLLSFIGGMLGWALSIVGVRAFVAAIPASGASETLQFTVDGSVLGFLGVVSIGTSLLFGLMPALRASRANIQAVLKAGSHTTAGAGRSGKLISASLVVASVALATVLLVGAGVMIRSFFYVDTLKLGMDPTRVATMRLTLPSVGRYADPADARAFQGRLEQSLNQIPGIEAAALITVLPAGGWMRNSGGSAPVEIEGRPITDRMRVPRFGTAVITPAYFRAVGAPLLNGREFSTDDIVTSERVVIVNQSFANQMWPKEDPIGKRVRLLGPGMAEAWRRVVGVAPNILQNDFDQGEGFIYAPFTQAAQRSAYVVARSTSSPSTLIQPLRQAVRSLDPDLAAYDLYTMEERIALRRFDVRLFGRIFFGFGFVALLLACTGLYAVVSDLVTTRSQEIGVRLAVGAAPRDIVRLVLTSGMRQIAIGLVIGLVVSLGLTRVLGFIFAGIPSADFVTLPLVAMLLAAAGLAGCAVPAMRAIRVDPVTTLRAQ